MDVEVIGEVPQSKPRKLQWDNGEPHFSLLTEDIAGSQPQRWVGSVPFNIYDPPEKKPIISFHEPQDIPGTQVGSLRKGIVTGRMTNPLNPRYTMLDGPAKMHPLAERADPMAGSIANAEVRTMLPADFKQHTLSPQDAMPYSNTMPSMHMPMPQGGEAPMPMPTAPREFSNTEKHLQAALAPKGGGSGRQTPLSHAGSDMMKSARSSRSGGKPVSQAQKMDSFIDR
jgi:hypothetical protein